MRTTGPSYLAHHPRPGYREAQAIGQRQSAVSAVSTTPTHSPPPEFTGDRRHSRSTQSYSQTPTTHHEDLPRQQISAISSLPPQLLPTYSSEANPPMSSRIEQAAAGIRKRGEETARPGTEGPQARDDEASRMAPTPTSSEFAGRGPAVGPNGEEDELMDDDDY
jgi:hypothetical protein